MTDEKWMQAIAARDERAMRRLMDKYSRLLWSAAQQALDLPVKQIENRLYRAKRHLRDQLTLY